jgi:hypothetical protein
MTTTIVIDVWPASITILPMLQKEKVSAQLWMWKDSNAA